ncbi:hypothetical protein PVT68_16835 [Microbulbifer bruguierae]|uniref:Uncharacterized protein n=1 Tax=Microbulbifer bruguierae TaxID=3029061 RepID=A0ABY8NBX3_9GAMM|nr:hypothetical protein [Microbulbifer bruguierae]WGL16418.1 hypothetical protein PVT68_16835 [Microbulbifer bruguierae]
MLTQKIRAEATEKRHGDEPESEVREWSGQKIEIELAWNSELWLIRDSDLAKARQLLEQELRQALPG